MDGHRLEGLLRDVAGRLQGVLGGSALGGSTGDAAVAARGRADEVAGQARHAYGEVLDVVERVASSRPLLTAAAAASAGFLLGLLAARR